MDPNIPHVLYQLVELHFDIDAEEIKGRTTLWLGFKEAISAGSQVYLHSRQCVMHKVSVNDVACNYTHNDALANLGPIDPQVSSQDNLSGLCQYSGSALDAQYRAALEVSRRGELEITIPEKVSPLEAENCTPEMLPSRCREDVASRFDKIKHLFRLLAYKSTGSTSPRPTRMTSGESLAEGGEKGDNLESVPPAIAASGGRLLKISIEYTVSKFYNRFSGVAFRRCSASSSGRGAEGKSNLSCIYSSHGGNGSIVDVDGVRCWLPCIDFPNQRTVFDISLIAPENCSIKASGNRIKSSIIRDPKQSHMPLTKSRFFTVTRIPATSVGFFIGFNVEKYKLSLYKLIGVVWIALGIVDQEINVNETGKSSPKCISTIVRQNHSSDSLEKPLMKKFKLHTDVGITSADVDHSVANEVIEIQHNDDVNDDFDALDVGRNASAVLPSNIASGDELSMSVSRGFGSGTTRSWRYQNIVKHTTLGLDIGLKQIHQYTGHRYDHQSYTQIFVPELGDDFIAFDGFSIIDARFLHSDKFIYQETASHLLQITAYLYSWIKSSVPIDSNDCEFIIHGIVGFLVNDYAEQLYGEESGKYRLQKMIDSVVEIEKSGRGYPLVSFFPERFETNTLVFQQLLRSKSTVLMHIIEERIGGKESMRSVIQNLIKSPPLQAPFNAKLVTHSSNAAASVAGDSIEASAMQYGSLSQSTSWVDEAAAAAATTLQSVHNSLPSLMNTSPQSLFAGSDQYCDYQFSPRHNSARLGGSPVVSYGEGSPGGSSYGLISPAVAGLQSPEYYGQPSSSPREYGQQSPSPRDYGYQSPYTHAYGTQSPYAVYGQQQQSSYHQNYGMQSPYARANAYGQQSPYSQAYGQQSPYSQAYGLQSPQGDSLADRSLYATTYGQQSPYATDHGNRSSLYVLPAIQQSPDYMMMTSPLSNHDQLRDNMDVLGTAIDNDNVDHNQQKPQSTREQLISPGSLGTFYDIENSLLSCESLALDTFVAAIRSASKTTSSLDESFMENYVFGSGTAFVRFGLIVEPKLDNRPQFMSLFCDQIGAKYGEINQKYSFKEPVKIRIAEVRDDIVSEVSMKIAPGTEHQSKQLYSRPGRKSGRRKVEIDDKLAPNQQAELKKRLADRDAQRDIVQVVRDLDQPIRYCLLEPSSLMMGEIHSIVGDVQLIEQLYADIDQWDILRQIQAIRSLSRADALRYPNVSKDAREGAVSKKAEKLPRLQLRALYDCLMASALTDVTQKGVLTSGHSLYARIEAAFALANWQNERAPVLTETSSASDAVNNASSDRPIESKELSAWAGCELIEKALMELYADAGAGLPLSCDYTREGSMQLRGALLLALSSIKALNGVTPSRVVNTLLLFAENEINEPVEIEMGDLTANNSTIPAQNVKNQEKNVNPKPSSWIIFDDSHVKSVYLLALSRIRMENYSKPAELETFKRICSYANRILNTEEAAAKAAARMATSNSKLEAGTFCRESGNYSYLRSEPVLNVGGVVVAAAIACLASMDIQATLLRRQAKTVSGCYVSKSGVTGPTGCGFVSGLAYTSFFAPVDHKFSFIHNVSASGVTATVSGISHHAKDTVEQSLFRSFETLSHKDDDSLNAARNSRFDMASMAVKIAALESFLALCLVQCEAFNEKYLIQQKQYQQMQQQQLLSNSTSSNNVTPVNSMVHNTFVFVAAMFEAVCLVIKSDSCKQTRIAASQALLDAVQDRPLGRSAFKALALGEPWLCLGFADPMACTLPSFASTLLTQNRRGKATVYRDLIMQSNSSSQLVNQTTVLWDMMCVGCAADQSVRGTLLTAWLCMFGPQAPMFMPISSNNEDELTPFASLLNGERAKPKDPLDCSQKIEMALRHGAKYRPALVSDKRGTASTGEKLRISAGNLSIRSSQTHPSISISTNTNNSTMLAAPSADKLVLSSPRPTPATPVITSASTGTATLKISFSRSQLVPGKRPREN